MWNPGSEQVVTTQDGRTWTLGRLTVGVLRAFREYVGARVGDPFERVERFLGRIPEEESRRQLREAEEVAEQLRYFSLGCPIAQALLGTEEGSGQLMFLLLRERHPQATLDDGLAVAIALLERDRDLAAVIEKAQGDVVGNATTPAA